MLLAPSCKYEYDEDCYRESRNVNKGYKHAITLFLLITLGFLKIKVE